MSFLLVEFLGNKEGKLAVVHDNWMTPFKTQVFWPPYKQKSQFNKALLKGEEAKDTWELFKIKRCFYTSDEGNEGLLPRPPKIGEFKRRTLEEGIKLGCTSIGDIEIENNPATPKSSRIQILEESAFNKRIITLLETISEQNKRILSNIERKQQPANIGPSLPELPVQLPVKNLVDLQLLDNYLKGNADQSSALSSYLAILGGKDITNKITRVLKYLVVDKVAKFFNFYGKRSKKEAFCDLALRNIIIRAIKSTEPQADDSAIEGAIKVWLKHAPGRLEINKDPAPADEN
ncbi:unnamed protein product [Brassicogethes aeneus]|uniref:DUF4806 domain-containing protein n=1 Tax=Brassicogethes aeneus TaxID=1431903 RepID=A0A9P0BED5_BRAAE|nr:unnamed protein product [Brassicogethes aeneus]